MDLIGLSDLRLLGIPLYASMADVCGLNGWHFSSVRSRSENAVTLRNYLLSVQPPFHIKGLDSFTWGVGSEPPVTFSTKDTWNHLMPLEEKKSWAHVVWFKCVVLKHAFTFWVANLNMLPVRSRLAS